MNGHSIAPQHGRDAALPATDGATPSGTVLIVDDESHLVGMYAAMLEDKHTILTATSGETALDQMSDDLDVVLLDRRMPALSGDEVLNAIREEGYNCGVAMVTSIEPDTGIVELPFDAYVVKPVRQRDLRELVQDLLLRSQYSASVQKLFAISSKLTALESQFDETELEDHEQYRRLQDQREQLRVANEKRIGELLDRGDTGLVYRDVLGAVEKR